MNLKKRHTKSGVHSSHFLLLRKPEFFRTFSESYSTKITHNVWKKSNFLKIIKGLLCLPHLVYIVPFSSLVKVCKEKVTNIFNQEELVDFEFPYKLLTSPSSCPDYPACPHNCEGVYYSKVPCYQRCWRMYNRGRDSMEFFMFINSTVHRGGFRALRKRGVDTRHYKFY